MYMYVYFTRNEEMISFKYGKNDINIDNKCLYKLFIIWQINCYDVSFVFALCHKKCHWAIILNLGIAEIAISLAALAMEAIGSFGTS